MGWALFLLVELENTWPGVFQLQLIKSADQKAPACKKKSKSEARQGEARLSRARRSEAERSVAKRGEAWRSVAKRGEAWRSVA